MASGESSRVAVAALLAGLALLSVAPELVWPVYIRGDEYRTCAPVVVGVGTLSLWLGIGRSLRRVIATCAVLVLAELLLRSLEFGYQPVVQPVAVMGERILRALGVEAGTSNGTLWVREWSRTYGFTPYFGLVFARPCLVFLIGFLLLGASAAIRVRVLAVGVIITALVVFAAFLASVLQVALQADALTDTHHIAIRTFWSPWRALLVLFVTSGALLTLVPPPTWRPYGRWSMDRAAAISAVGLGLVAGIAAGLDHPGTWSPPRVLIDDRLSMDWEPAGRLLTEDHFGDFSTYSFAAACEQLSRRYEVDVNSTEPYTDELLDEYDVLILKTPQVDLGSNEVSAISEWVAGGGGLFAIGDHTDLVRMNTVLNTVTAPMGITFQFDSTGSTADRRGELFVEEPLLEHPVAVGVGEFEVMSGCTIALEPPARPVMVMRQAWSMLGDYSRASHFGTLGALPDRAHGACVIAASARLGAGRVVGFSDSTVLSSFEYFEGGHDTFVNRSVAWLAHEGRAPILYWIGLGLVAFVLAARLAAAGAGVGVLVDVIGVGAIAALVGAAVGGRVAGDLLHVPEPLDDRPSIGILREGVAARFPKAIGSADGVRGEDAFSSLGMLAQRCGLETRPVLSLERQLPDLEALIVARPARTLLDDARAIECLGDWIRRGGVLYLFEGEPLYEPLAGRPYPGPSGENWLDSMTVGAGRIVVGHGSIDVSNKGLGHCMSLPTAEQRARISDLIASWRDQLGGRGIERRIYTPSLASVAPVREAVNRR